MDACGEPMGPDLGPSGVMGGEGPNTVTLKARSGQAKALPKRTAGGEGYKASRSNSGHVKVRLTGGQTDMAAEEDVVRPVTLRSRSRNTEAHTARVRSDMKVWFPTDPPRFGHQVCPDLWIGVYDDDLCLSCTYSEK